MESITDLQQHIRKRLTEIEDLDERKHTAYSRSVFAKGAVQAAKFLSGKPAGFYDMGDVIKATIA